MVPVLDRRGAPLDPCSEKRARLLLERGRAVVVGHAPFTIRLRDRVLGKSVVHPLECKLDPGSKTTGMAMVRKEDGTDVLVAAVHVEHKTYVSTKLKQRHDYRRRRRSGLWHRKKRFSNRSPAACASCAHNAVHGRSRCRPCAGARAERSDGARRRRLPPSLRARVDETLHAVGHQVKLYPVGAVIVEVARFDTQLLRQPGISGKGYQEGLLYESNLREYVLTRDRHACRYCGKSGVVLNLDHVVPRSRGGTTGPGNLVASCVPCNMAKGDATAAEFGHPEVQAQVDVPLKDAAYMNATRYEVADRLRCLGLPVSVSHGGVTRANRVRLGLGKDHYVDALCVGDDVAEHVKDATNGFLAIAEHKGRGSHQRSKPVPSKPCWGCGKSFSNDKKELTKPKSKALKLRNKFCPSCRDKQAPDNHYRRKAPPVRFYTHRKSRFGFSTGDLVRADVPNGVHKGTHIGRVGFRESGSFKITVGKQVLDGVSHKYCRLIKRGAGWSLTMEQRPVLLPALTDGASAPEER
jgi:hypothetical protein